MSLLPSLHMSGSVRYELLRTYRHGGTANNPLAVATGFVHCRLLSLRAWHAQQQQQRRGAAWSSLGSQLNGPAAAVARQSDSGGLASASEVAAVQQHGIGPLPDLHHSSHGSIELLVGPMFAGKTSALLARVAQYEAAGLSVAVVKSNKDNRYDGSAVVTHDGLRKPCYAVPTLAAFREAAGQSYKAYQVVAVDEAQFFPDLRDFALAAADHERKHVVLAGLDGDFQRQRFGQVLDILPLADKVTKLHATCTYCEQESLRGSRAVFSLRIAADSRQEVVGGADKYAPVCRRHYVHLSGLRRPSEAGAAAVVAVEHQVAEAAAGDKR